MRPLLSLTILLTPSLTLALPLKPHQTNYQGYVSFDVSMPIDSTGYRLQGKHLHGGHIQFSAKERQLSPLLQQESATLALPNVINHHGQSLIDTTVSYNAIKFINPNGINNLFITVGLGNRHQNVKGLDPSVLKNGSYSWQAPIFATGKNSGTVNHKSHGYQFMQVGSMHDGPASKNVMYTQNFYLFTRSNSNAPLLGHPIKYTQSKTILTKPYHTNYTCKADGLWGAGGADPYRTITGHCHGNTITMPAGPHLDYEYGSFTLPTVHTPWSATKNDHCIFPNGEKHTGCVNASIALKFHYIAQKIRVPIDKNVTLFAEAGTAYRHIKPTHLRYVCKSNVYLKKILPQTECLKNSYKAGGASYTYFAVGYMYQSNDGKRYIAKYITIPGQENGNRLIWLDSSNTYVYAINSPDHNSQTQKYLAKALTIIKNKQPAVYKILGETFLMPMLARNYDDSKHFTH